MKTCPGEKGSEEKSVVERAREGTRPGWVHENFGRV
jgi:hypothetical protein